MSPLAAALDEVAGALSGARDPWWVIGSAAVRLHGIETSVADVDVLVSARDALDTMATWRGDRKVGAPDERFRSSLFVRLSGAALPVELMAGLHVRSAGQWVAVQPVTRRSISNVFVPEPAELAAIFSLFGRPKDRERSARLRGAVDPAPSR
jgi:hypothetical protein